MLNLLTSLVGPVSSILDKYVEDKDAKNALAHEIATMAERHAQELAKAQIEVNKAEASHTSLFVSGWRPAVGWVCVTGMGANFIAIPTANFILTLTDVGTTIPLVPLSEMMPVLMGMLGLGALRTVEKTKGVQRDK